MLEGKYQLISVRQIQGKNGAFRIAKLGDSEKCSSFSLFIPSDLVLPEGLKEGSKVSVQVALDEVSYKLRATLQGLKLA